jgi:hypothetical protein
VNTLSIVILALGMALNAIRTIEPFITDKKVRSIFQKVASAIEIALKALEPHQKAAQEAAARGEPIPATAPKPQRPARRAAAAQ